MGAPAAAREGQLPPPRALLALLALTAAVGLVVSLASWGFLELLHQLQTAVFDDLPRELGYDGGAPVWWPLPVLAVAGVLTALAIQRLPGGGGHDPASGFRGGPTFPGLLLGVAAGLLASHLPGLAVTPAVAVGMGAAMAAVLRLPLASVVLATLLTAHAGAGVEPLIILGVVAAYLTSTALHRRAEDQDAGEPSRRGRTRLTSSATTVTR